MYYLGNLLEESMNWLPGKIAWGISERLSELITEVLSGGISGGIPDGIPGEFLDVSQVSLYHCRDFAGGILRKNTVEILLEESL